MAYPAFSKTGVTTLTFSQGSVTPDIEEEEPRQIVSEAENGAQWVYTLAPPVKTHTIAFQDLPASDLAALEAFLRDPLVDWAGNIFTYTDAESTAHTVRYVGGTLRKPRTAVDTYDVSLVLREQ